MPHEGPPRAPDARTEYLGHLAEADALGVIDTEDPAYRRAAEQWYRANAGLVQKFNQRRLSERERAALFGSAFHLIEHLPEYRDHPERVTNPAPPVLRDLRLAVAEGLELATEAEMERVKAFTAVGSPIDKHLGIDGFLRIEGRTPHEPATYVTLDYTINPEKERSRADVLIKKLPDPDLAEEAYVEAVDRAGEEVVNQYRRKVLVRRERPPGR